MEPEILMLVTLRRQNPRPTEIKSRVALLRIGGEVGHVSHVAPRRTPHS